MTNVEANAHNRLLALLRSSGAFIVLFVLLAALAACGGDDDDDTGQVSVSPTSSAAAATTAGSSPTATGSNGTAQPTLAPTFAGTAEPTPATSTVTSGTATIAGIQYDFTVLGCTVGPDLVIVTGSGLAPDGRPFIATAQWSKIDYRGIENAVEVGIGTNAESLFDLPEQVLKLGTPVAGSTVSSLEIDIAAFNVSVTGTFVDLNDTSAPPVDGSFSLSCTPT